MQSITAGKQCNIIILDYNNSVEYNTGGKRSEGVNKINVFPYLLMQFSFTIISVRNCMFCFTKHNPIKQRALQILSITVSRSVHTLKKTK